LEQISRLLRQHPGFTEFAKVIITGMPYRYSKEVSEEVREQEVLAMLTQGNQHKLAQEEPEIVEKLLSKDVIHGFSMVQPVGLAKQWTLHEHSNRIVKYRITQDLSYSETGKDTPVSVNSRIDMGQYPEMVYGWALPRIIHFIVALHLDGLLIADLVLWIKLLAKAHEGISMHLIVTRRPNQICWSAACPFGMGGFLLRSGRAWRIRIPSTSILYGSTLINNLLECLGMAINIWLECQQEACDHDCILALGDNTSAVGWLHSSSRLNVKLAAHSAHLL
jgi:hypothetical protein